MKIIRKPAVFMALALSTGLLSSSFLLNFNLLNLFRIILLIEIIYFTIFTINRLSYNKKSIYIWLTILFLLIGSFLSAYQNHKLKSQYSLNNFTGTGAVKILAEIKFNIGDLESNKVYLKPYYINDQKIKYGKILISSEKLKQFTDGDLVALKLELSKPDSALNPGAFSYADYLKKEEVYLQGWNVQDIILLQRNLSSKQLVIKFKKRLLNNINQLFSEANAAFIKAILLGEKEYLSYEQESLLKKAGASHLLAISGLHMGIIILTFSFIFLKLFSKKKNALYLLSFLTFFYIIIVGASVSIIRAAVLAILFLWSAEFHRKGDFLNIISITLIINLILEPNSLFTVSLQFSYLLVLALFYLSPLLSRFMHPVFAVSLTAQLASLTITAYYFNEYASIAFLTNLWIIPYITFLLPFIFILVLLSLFNLSFLIFFVFLAEMGLKLLFRGLKLMTLIQRRSLVIGEIELILVVVYYLLLFSLPYLYQRRYIYLKAKKYFFWQKAVPLLILLIIISFFVNPVSDNLEINFVAVGQGDGIFIQFPGKKNMLIDTGPPGKEGRNIEYNIISYLNYLGISSIDYLMISHFDADHAGGISHLLQRKKVKNILIPPFKKKSKLHLQLEAAATTRKFKLNLLTSGMSFEINGCRLDILNPESNIISQDRNENSIVFLLTHQQHRFLFTGDISKERERKILQKTNLAEIDILKAGHHGSKTSSGEMLLDKVKPKLAVISVGKNNFGHPSPEVLKRFEKKSIQYLRTDQRGMIKVVSDGQNIFLSTYK